MLRHMSPRLIAPACLSVATLFLVSCGADSDTPMLAGDTQSASSEGETLYQQAKQADDAGKASRAIKLYDQTATRYPFAPSAAQARFRQAQLLEQQGEVEDAFEAYDKFLERFPGNCPLCQRSEPPSIDGPVRRGRRREIQLSRYENQTLRR